MVRSAVPETSGSDGLSGESLTSLDKALALLTSFDASRRPLGVTELARRAGIPKSTAHRLLAVLLHWDLVVREGTMYVPGPKLMELASQGRDRQFRDLALPHLQNLYDITRATVCLAILRQQDVLYLEKIVGYGSVMTPGRVGARTRALSSPLGMVMLAHRDLVGYRDAIPRLPDVAQGAGIDLGALRLQLERIRRDGVAYGDPVSGIASIAAPVISPTLGLLGAVSLSGSPQRFVPSQVVLQLRTATVRIARSFTAAFLD
ncbi:IclR family transcriptional regulator [Microbacterium sp. X-17]|uniref:IclR family transcriptional regulator n=1 Tax=Microbacterium sp. X-17 TaxID=3144404 RepID=UPI0031F57753